MEVRRILNQVWDPIGIGDLPDAEGEYDNYVGEIYVMLMDREAKKPPPALGKAGLER